MISKLKPLISKKLRDSAKDQECTFQNELYKDYYIARAMIKTWRKWFEIGVLKV